MGTGYIGSYESGGVGETVDLTTEVTGTLPIANGGTGQTTLTALSLTTTTLLGNTIVGGGASASEMRFLEPSGSGTNYSAFKAQAQAANVTYTLPAAVGAAGAALTDAAGNGTLSWVVPSSGITGTLTDGRITVGAGASALQDYATLTYDGNSQTITRTSIGASYSTPGLAILNTTTGSEQHSPSLRLGGYATATQEDWYITNAANAAVSGPSLAFVSASGGSASSIRTNLQEISSVIYFGTTTNHTFRLLHNNTGLLSLQNDGVRNQVLVNSSTFYLTAAAAAGYPGMYAYGAIHTGGSSTNTKPYIFVEPASVATSNNWDTAGSFFGINAATGFVGNFIDCQLEAVRKFRVSYTGDVTTTGFYLRSTTAAITASTTQTQGQGALTTEVNEVATCANANDTVTLPVAAAGKFCLVINNGAQTLRVYPASGDDLGGGADTATTINAGSRKLFVAFDGTYWEPVI